VRAGAMVSAADWADASAGSMAASIPSHIPFFMMENSLLRVDG